MKFCKKCGGALNFFETNEEEICWSCVRKNETNRHVTPSTPDTSEDLPELSDATFTLEGEMLTLKSPEGWLLWSGPIGKEVKLADILKRARRIHQIRSKRLQHKN